MSPSMNTQVSGDNFEDRQFVVLASEKQARVVALPSQNCIYRQQLAESHIVIKAEVTSLKGIHYLLLFYTSKYVIFMMILLLYLFFFLRLFQIISRNIYSFEEYLNAKILLFR
jgi:hypothetical protein